MESISVKSCLTDAFKAGLDIGAQLETFNPDVVFLFCASHYDAPQSIVEAIYEFLDSGVQIIGCSGDGNYSTDGARNIGISALALKIPERSFIKTVHQRGLAADTVGTVQTALDRLSNEDTPKLIVLLADFRTDASEIERVLERYDTAPIVGGLASDDFQMKHCFLFHNQNCFSDAVTALGFYGDFKFNIYVGNDLTDVGDVGTVTEASGVRISMVDNTHASKFIEKQTSKPVLPTDRGVTSFLIIDEHDKRIKRLRSILNPHAVDAALDLYGGIRVGEKIKVCTANPETLKNEVSNIVKSIANESTMPESAMIFSCTGRKYTLGEDIKEEVDQLRHKINDKLSISGFPTFGEFSPMRLPGGKYSRNLFHNMTYVVVTFQQSTGG